MPQQTSELNTLYTPLPAAFFIRDTLTVAEDLLGHWLVWQPPSPDSGKPLPPQVFEITETEAYTQDDPACHAYQKIPGSKISARAATLYKAPGLAYVYLIYGMYNCLNVVTEAEGKAGAVLFRALAPLAKDFALNTCGPGRLARALGITRQAHNEQPLTSNVSSFYLAENPARAKNPAIIRCPRIGVSVATELPWRFYLADSTHISVRDSQDKRLRAKRKSRA